MTREMTPDTALHDAAPVEGAHTIGIVGTGKLGRTLAVLSTAAGLDVVVAGSGSLSRTSRILDTFAQNARAVSLAEAAQADIVVLAIPLSDAEDLDPELFRGSVVVDPMNHWEEADGPRPDFDDPSRPTSVAIQQLLTGSAVVKAFNHVAYKDLAGGARAVGNTARWGIAVASNDDRARGIVSGWVTKIGFDPVDAGPLGDTYALQPGGTLFGATLNASQLEAALKAGGRG